MIDMLFRRFLLISCVLMLPMLALSFRQTKEADPLADLQRKSDRGEIKLEFDQDRGYLKSILEALNVPISSQMLVFAKNSFQLHLISPETPRALYFNDDSYVGYVPGADAIELAVVDPKDGPVFYTLPQTKVAKPKFHRESSQCTVCHDSSQTADPIPRLLMLSVLPDPNGTAIKREAFLTNDKSPFRERWGGWYVTGTHGSQRHLGNRVVQEPAAAIGDVREFLKTMNLDSGANVTDLTRRIDTNPFPSKHSDIVALMLHGHQTHIHNLIALIDYKVRYPDRNGNSVEELAERLFKSMIFVEAEPFTDQISGSTNFASEFVNKGIRDSKGRSLRDLDLKTRLFRYPLSFLIYSPSFDGLPAPAKQHIYRRLREVLSGEDTSKDFAHLSEADRKNILEILLETKPDFASSFEKRGR